MGIDWITLAAQIINLIVLLFILRRFLYLPVLKAVNARQKLIADELQNAEDARKTAQRSEAVLANKIKGIEEEKRRILAKVHEDAHELENKLSEEAKQHFQTEREKWQKRLISEQKNFDTSLQQSVLEHFNRLMQEAVKKISDADWSEMTVRQFMRKISELPIQRKEEFIRDFHEKKSIGLETAYQMPEQLKEQLEAFLIKEWQLSEPIEFDYTINENLISGIAVQAAEQRVEWSFERYMEEFRKEVKKEILQMLNRGEK